MWYKRPCNVTSILSSASPTFKPYVLSVIFASVGTVIFIVGVFVSVVTVTSALYAPVSVSGVLTTESAANVENAPPKTNAVANVKDITFSSYKILLTNLQLMYTQHLLLKFL